MRAAMERQSYRQKVLAVPVEDQVIVINIVIALRFSGIGDTFIIIGRNHPALTLGFCKAVLVAST
jgi:hypothetical protein